jgi:hypothetical protein
VETLSFDYGAFDPASLSPPSDPPPPRTAPYEERAAWSERYVAWYLAQAPRLDGARPSDVEPTHRYEVEFNSCVLDPQEYARDTRVELEDPPVLQ